MNLQIEMFSEMEYKAFGTAVFGFIVIWIFTYLIIGVAYKIIKEKNEKSKRKRKNGVSRYYEVDKNEFVEIGEAAIRQQKMKSFIMETSQNRFVEVREENEKY